MKAITLTLLITATLLTPPCLADSASAIYQSMTGLEGEWRLSPADQQQGKATQHKLVAPLVADNAVGMSFKLIGKGSTVQENLLPGTKKEMVSMYHCLDAACSQVKATHYCVKQNQPEMLADPASTATLLVYNCDMRTALCQSGQNHIHTITHQLSDSDSHLQTTYTSWKDGKYLKDSIYHFDRI